MRILWRLLGVLFVVAAPRLALANSAAWFDPDLGCGRDEVFAKTGRVEDLPGCTGTLPKNAPEAEVLLREAKLALIAIDRKLSTGNASGIEAELDRIALILGRKPAPNPDLPDRFVQARASYDRAVSMMRSRARLAPRMARLRDAHHAAVLAWKNMTAHERDGGGSEAQRLANACLAEFAEARASGIDLQAEAELEPGKVRKLEEALGECQTARNESEPLAHAEELALSTTREDWRKKMRGDRLKVLLEHPGLPDLSGAMKNNRSLKQALHATEWIYRVPGQVEVYRFVGDRLVGREVHGK